MRYPAPHEEANVSERSYNKTLGVLRKAALFVILVAVLIFAEPTPMSVTIGFIFMALGEAVRFWSAGHLRKTVELITSGPYRYTRNPLYLGRLLILTGLAIMCRLPYNLHWIFLIGGLAVFFFYYYPRKERVEPKRLRELHGEPYERYFEAVPGLFPRMTPWPEGSGAGWGSDRMFRNREQWMVVMVVGVTLIMLYKAYALDA
jgi:protein-S-isoprenylcysteine O-methyltransferase Ste14